VNDDVKYRVDAAMGAAHAADLLGAWLRRSNSSMVRCRVEDDDAALTVDLARRVLEHLVEILDETGWGRTVTVVPDELELTTQQAADLLNVSRPYVIKLLERNAMPFRLVGNRRYIAVRDVLAFRRADDASRRERLGSLTEAAARRR
jgi:excisionase family DNA binding protein